MDPNATLNQILDLAKLYATKKSKRGDLARALLTLDGIACNGISRRDVARRLSILMPWVRPRLEYCEMASLVDALNTWIEREGFLPDRWTH